MERLQIETGIKKYEIEDENGDLLGVIRIDPKDLNMLVRCEEVEKNVLALIESVDKIVETEELETAEKKVIEIDEKIKEQLNYLFDYDVSSVIFGNRHCLNTNHGIPFIQRFMDMIIPVVENVVKKENKESRERISKYTKQYGKQS